MSLSWKALWFVNILFAYLFLGRLLSIPYITSGISSLLVFAVLGFKWAFRFWFFSNVLDYRTWNLYLWFYSLLTSFTNSFTLKLSQMRARGLNDTQISQNFTSSLPSWIHTPVSYIPKSYLPTFDVLIYSIGIPLIAFLMIRRIRKIRKRLGPIIRRLPA